MKKSAASYTSLVWKLTLSSCIELFKMYINTQHIRGHFMLHDYVLLSSVNDCNNYLWKILNNVWLLTSLYSSIWEVRLNVLSIAFIKCLSSNTVSFCLPVHTRQRQKSSSVHQLLWVLKPALLLQLTCNPVQNWSGCLRVLSGEKEWMIRRNPLSQFKYIVRFTIWYLN